MSALKACLCLSGNRTGHAVAGVFRRAAAEPSRVALTRRYASAALRRQEGGGGFTPTPWRGAQPPPTPAAAEAAAGSGGTAGGFASGSGGGFANGPRGSAAVVLLGGAIVGVHLHYLFFVRPKGPAAVEAYRRKYGASLPALLVGGDTCLLTSGFVHESPIHAVINLALLYGVGPAVCRLAPGGPATMIGVFLASAYMGSAAFCASEAAHALTLIRERDPAAFFSLQRAMGRYRDSMEAAALRAQGRTPRSPLTGQPITGGAEVALEEEDSSGAAASAAAADSSAARLLTPWLSRPPSPGEDPLVVSARRTAIRALLAALASCPDAQRHFTLVGEGASAGLLGLTSYLALSARSPLLVSLLGSLLLVEAWAASKPHQTAFAHPRPALPSAALESREAVEGSPSGGGSGSAESSGSGARDEMLDSSWPGPFRHPGSLRAHEVTTHPTVGHAAHLGGAAAGAALFVLGRGGRVVGTLARAAAMRLRS